MEGKRGFRYNELWGNTKRGVGKMEKRDKNISYLRFVITYNIVLLIPLLIVSFSVFYMVHRQHYRKIMDETAAVSYTHLDVYKRQAVCAEGENRDTDGNFEYMDHGGGNRFPPLFLERL